MPIPTRDDSGKFPAFAWPGGYPLYYVCMDGGILCPDCTNNPDNPIEVITKGKSRLSYDTQWTLIAVDVNWEDEACYCDHCNKTIESAYGGE